MSLNRKTQYHKISFDNAYFPLEAKEQIDFYISFVKAIKHKL